LSDLTIGEVTRRAFRPSPVSYAERVALAIEAADFEPTLEGLYRITAPLDAFGMVYATTCGLVWRRERLADIARWEDDGGR
jgi:hypothetical protein